MVTPTAFGKGSSLPVTPCLWPLAKPSAKEAVSGGAAWSLPRKAAYLCPSSSLEVPRRKAHLCNILCTSHLIVARDESTWIGAIRSLTSQGRVWLNLTLFSIYDNVFGFCWLQVGKQPLIPWNKHLQVVQGSGVSTMPFIDFCLLKRYQHLTCLGSLSLGARNRELL